MSFFSSLLPIHTPSSVAGKNRMLIRRERILQVMLLILCIFGLPAIIFAASGVIADKKFGLAVVYAGIYLLFLGLLIARNLPYFLRAAIVVSITYLLAISELFESGQLGEVRMFLIVFIALSSVLFDFRVALGSVFLGLLTIISLGTYTTLVPNSPISAFSHINEGTNWVTSSVVFLMISVLVSGSVSMIIYGLGASLEEMARLTQSLENERNALEERVQKRSQETMLQITKLRTAAEISRTISILKNQDELLQQIVDTLRERFGLYYVGVFLVDEEGRFAILQAGTGSAGQKMVADGYRLAVDNNSMIGWSILNHRPRITLDASSDAIRFLNPLLPQTRSEMALPIIAHDEILGALTIQSDQPDAFDESDSNILQSIADGLAVALENTRIFQKTRENLEEIRALNREYLQRSWTETMQAYGDLSYEYDPQPDQEDQPANAILIPLTLRGEEIGQILVEIDRSDLTEEESTLIENISIQTVLALENARLLEETERRALQEQKLNELGTRFSRATSIAEILRAAAQELGQLPAVNEVLIHLNPAETDAPQHDVFNQQLAGGKNGKEAS